MELRQHQKDVQIAVNNIVNGSASYKQIIARVTPGGGKSLLPQIAGALLMEAGLIDKICCVVPRKKLQDQMAKDFLDPCAREVIGHQLSIREATNEYDPARDSDGFVTTYQALAMDSVGVNADALDKHRYLLVLDEYHHIGEGELTHQRIQPLVDRASYVLLMTGTLARNKGLPIAYTPYKEAR
jgi:superfamily II DNA or RNA helicase